MYVDIEREKGMLGGEGEQPFLLRSYEMQKRGDIFQKMESIVLPCIKENIKGGNKPNNNSGIHSINMSQSIPKFEARGWILDT